MAAVLRSWGVRPLTQALGGLLCAAFAVALLISGNPEDRLVSGTGLLMAALGTAAALSMRQRLSAGPDGFALRGPGGLRQFSWRQVVAIEAPTRRRRGLASTAVELDLDDDGLIVLGKLELGADPADVAIELQQWWRAQRP